MSATDTYDLLIIGGGINGAGIARDAAGRGLRVALAERDDLAQHTSSASTKLIHGGLRYLEQGALRLVRESLEERETLLRIAPHLVRPLEFVIAPTAAARPAWMMRAGLFLYDRLGGRSSLPRSHSIDLAADPRGAALRRRGMGHSYWDCWVDDSRLVILNLIDAAERGCAVWPRTEVISASRTGQAWTVRLNSEGAEREVRAVALVNAAGPWVGELAARIAAVRQPRVRLVKGSHILLPRLYDGAHAYLLQTADRRVVFAIPYLRDLTLVGTTDVPVSGPERTAEITAEEVTYLLGAVQDVFARRVGPEDVRGSFAGVRPLQEDRAGSASRVTRDYALGWDDSGPPLVTVVGGKLTTYRRLAEKVMALLGRRLAFSPEPWTGGVPLPGGAEPPEATLRDLRQAYPMLPPPLLERLAGAYGSRAAHVLGDTCTLADLGEMFGDQLSRREVDYLVRHEWARSADDILKRRTRLGLEIDPEAAARLAAYLAARER